MTTAVATETNAPELSKIDKKVFSAIRRLSKARAIDIMDDAVGVSCYDDDADKTREELKQHYLNGAITAAEILDRD